jgi:hypothetical protein
MPFSKIGSTREEASLRGGGKIEHITLVIMCLNDVCDGGTMFEEPGC